MRVQERERFQNNPHIVGTLQECADSPSMAWCGQSHLNDQCDMDGLPVIERMTAASDIAQVSGRACALYSELGSYNTGA